MSDWGAVHAEAMRIAAQHNNVYAVATYQAVGRELNIGSVKLPAGSMRRHPATQADESPGERAAREAPGVSFDEARRVALAEARRGR